jgi:hypothetical protein
LRRFRLGNGKLTGQLYELLVGERLAIHQQQTILPPERLHGPLSVQAAFPYCVDLHAEPFARCDGRLDVRFQLERPIGFAECSRNRGRPVGVGRLVGDLDHVGAAHPLDVQSAAQDGRRGVPRIGPLSLRLLGRRGGNQLPNCRQDPTDSLPELIER